MANKSGKLHENEFPVKEIFLSKGLPENKSVEFLSFLLKDTEQSNLQNIEEKLLQKIIEKVEMIPLGIKKVASTLRNQPQITIKKLLNDEFLLKDKIIHELSENNYKHLREEERHILAALAIYNRPTSTTAIAMVSNLLDNSHTNNLDYTEDILNQLNLNHWIDYSHEAEGWQMHEIDEEVIVSQVSEKDLLRMHKCAAKFYGDISLPEEQWLTIADVETLLWKFEHLIKAQQHRKAARLLNKIDFQSPPKSSYLFNWGQVELAKNLRENLIPFLKNKKLKWKNWHQLGLAYTRLGLMKEATRAHKKALTLSKKFNSKNKKGISLMYLGLVQYHLHEFKNAINLYKKALSVNKETAIEGNNLGHLGKSLAMLDKLKKSIPYLKKAIEINQFHKDRRSESFWLGELGEIYQKANSLLEAESYLLKAIKLAAEIGDTQIEVYHLHNLGEIYKRRDEIEKSVDFYNEAIEKAKAIGDIWNLIISYWELALLYEQRNSKLAKETISKCVSYAEKVQHPALPKYRDKLESTLNSQI